MTAMLDAAAADPWQIIADLQRKLDASTAELSEAQERETATAEILEVINSSPGDIIPVFDAVLEKAMRLCEAACGHIFTYNGELFHPEAVQGEPRFIEWQRQRGPRRPSNSITLARIVGGDRYIHIADCREIDAYRDNPLTREGVDISSIRTLLTVSLRKDAALLGTITVYRKEVRPFSDKQIALLQNFAAQAVIAMENARLLGELRQRTGDLRESLEYQTATSDVLKVISRSTFDLQPVFETILATASRLCDADAANITNREGNYYRIVATFAASPEYDALTRGRLLPVDRGTITGRTALEGQVVHIQDIASDPEYAVPEAVTLGRTRSALGVPLLREGVVIGTINLARQRVLPFTDRQIELVRTFADQAVIALENARLITETQEALEQQTATAEVLQVINSSPGDLTPVFDAMLEKATTLCDAAFGIMLTWDGQCFHRVAFRGASAELIAALRQPNRLVPGSMAEQILNGAEMICAADIREEPAYRIPGAPVGALVDIGGARSYVAIALRKDDALLGLFSIYRQEVRPFSDKQIALLQNFAAQAVIAMENARLITETHEALEQQTATAEVLHVINSSPGDLAPVFDAMLEKALRLCEAGFGTLLTWDGECFNRVASRGLSVELVDPMGQRRKPVPGSVAERFVLGENIISIPNLIEDDAARSSPALQAIARVGMRSYVSVALRMEAQLFGYIAIFRQEVQPFTDKQIALLQNFAVQAVIAMENARLLTETREALEQQTATSEVLQIINSSPDNPTPVFDAMLEKAMRLCEAAFGLLFTYDSKHISAAALHNIPEGFAAFLRRGPVAPAPHTTLSRAIQERRPVQIMDVIETSQYRDGDPFAVTAVEAGGVRTVLSVPLLKDEVPVGVIGVYRQEVRSFTDKQIALLQNFAAQAVIAMENARLLTETREALEHQTATAEILRVISSSPIDVQPTFDAIAAAATTLTDAALSAIVTYDGRLMHLAALSGFAPGEVERVRALWPIPVDEGTATGRAILARQVVHIDDLSADPGYAYPRLAQVSGQTVLALPMLRDGIPIGAINVQRRRVEPFTDKQIDLFKTFADQAVIAIENVRLFNELNARTRDLEESLEYQTATSDVLNVISRSTSDVQPVLDTVVETAVRLCSADTAGIAIREGEVYRPVANYGMESEDWAALRQRTNVPGRGSMTGRVALEGRVVHVADVLADPDFAVPEIVAAGYRTILGVPLLREGVVLGTINLARYRVQPYTERQIELVRTFADQAVIAIENARLLDEIRQRQAELRVTFDNMVDGVAMFDAELRLAAWNRNFQELLDLPDDYLAQTHGFDEYVRYLTRRGEFGETDPETEIKRLRERLQEHYRFERMRPDGTVIEVRHNPMPDGGVVLIYSDITERKRSEAEIRAARDAAEAAYRDLKAAQASLIQAEKMASLGQLTAGIAHEIKNPLNFVNNFADLSVELLDELKETAAPAINALGDEKRAEIDETITMLTGNLEKIAEHGRRADGIVKSMLEHSRGTSGERRSVDLNGLIDEALNLAYHGARAQDARFNITLERDFADPIAPIELVPQDITRVCLNLIGNGFYAATKRQKEGSDPSFKPTLKVSTRDLGDAVEIRVRDNGTGIAPEIKDKLFQPFFTTKPTGEGTGLGLSISYDVVTQQHGGTITVDSRVGEFTEFAVRLPRTYQTAIAEAAS